MKTAFNGASMSRNILSLAVFASLCMLGLTANAHADCSNATLSGRYALRTDASPTTGGRRQVLALINYHGNGNYTNEGFTVNNNGVISRGTLEAKYQINSNCTGKLLELDGVTEQGDIIVSENGRELYFLRTNPANLMLTGVAPRVADGD
jgi:hypothetical protein